MYELLKQDGLAKRGRLHTVHGVIETPVFMNVGTVAAIKGAVSTDDLRQIKTQVELSNTYHLHVRPGDDVIRSSVVFTNSWRGINRFSLIPADFRCFRWQGFVRSRKRAYILILTLMERKFSWDRRKVCRSSQILHPPSPWHLMNVRPVWLTAIIWNVP